MRRTGAASRPPPGRAVPPALPAHDHSTRLGVRGPGVPRPAVEGVARWAGRLSEAWERIIRVGIADSVVDTGTQHVKPLMTKLLARFTDADHREYQDSYGRCSLWLTRHDKSDSVNYVAPEPSELEAELTRVRAWWSRVRGYRS